MIMKRRFERALETELAAEGLRSSVRVNRNRVRLVWTRRSAEGLTVHVSDRLIALGAEARSRIVAFARGEPDAKAALQRLFTSLPPAAPAARRSPVLVSIGRTYDLHTVLADARRTLEWAGALPQITWGRRLRISRGQKSVRLGSYDGTHKLIRVHRLLDDPQVPAWFLSYVVRHELLHHKLWVGESACRHSAAFRAEEASHPDYPRARAWLERELPRLMRRQSTA